MAAAPVPDPDIVFRLSAANRSLPSPSSIAVELMRGLERRDLGMRDIAQIVRKDPALAARMIRIANSAMFAGFRPAVAIEDAVLRIGTGGLARLAIVISVIGRDKWVQARGFDPQRFWTGSIHRGLLVQQLTRHVGRMHAAEAFSLGLLADIGLLAMVTAFGDEAIPADAGGGFDRLLVAQRQQFGFDQTDASAALLAHWGFPEPLAQAVRTLPSDPADEPARTSELGRCVALGRDLQAGVAGEVVQAAAERLGLTGEMVDTALAAAAGDMVGVAAAFELQIDQQDVDAELDRLRRALRPPPPPADPVADHVLVVSCDATTLRDVGAALHSAGHAVIPASDVAVAREAIETYGSRVVLLDWDCDALPVLCRELRAEHGQDLYLLALSRGTEPQDLVRILRDGANDTVSMPVLLPMLAAKVDAGARAARALAAAQAERRDGQRIRSALEQRNAELIRVSGTDDLTGLSNRRALDLFLGQAFSPGSVGPGRPLACIMFDLDAFKAINDRLGHDVGDRALREVARVLRELSRDIDFVARVGGEEFLMLCPQTDEAAALGVAERIRAAIAALDAGLPRITVSAGVAVAPRDAADGTTLLHRADQALLRAKREGRNRVCVGPLRAAEPD